MKHTEGLALWFTGLSGSGKSTTAEALAARLAESGRRVELLDGDELRRHISSGLGFSREDRMKNIERIVYISKLLSRNGVIVIVSAIMPYQEMREYARAELTNYCEVYVDCPLEVCERRDVKGLYAKARIGEISSFTGISDAYDIPVNPDMVINTAVNSLSDNTSQIVEWLATHGYVEEVGSAVQ